MILDQFHDHLLLEVVLITNGDLIIHILRPPFLKLFILEILNVFVDVLDIWHAEIFNRLGVIRVTIVNELLSNALRVFSRYTRSLWLVHDPWYRFTRLLRSDGARIEWDGTCTAYSIDLWWHIRLVILDNLNMLSIWLTHEFTVNAVVIPDLPFHPQILPWAYTLSIIDVKRVISQNPISHTEA